MEADYGCNNYVTADCLLYTVLRELSTADCRLLTADCIEGGYREDKFYPGKLAGDFQAAT